MNSNDIDEVTCIASIHYFACKDKYIEVVLGSIL